MSGNLYKVSQVSWAVKLDNDDEFLLFNSVDNAASFLEEHGVKDEEIDHALITMSAHNHVRANFGVNGNFLFSDNERPNEPLGSA